MKWIGQNIYDQISRFRDHAFFEDSITLSTGKSITMDEYTSGTISITKIQDSGTEFNNNDTSLLTAGAIAALVTGEDLDVAGDSGIAAVDLNSQSLTVTGGTGITTSATGQAVTINVDASQAGITTVGTIGTGVWNGTAIASAYLDADTAHLSGTQSFTGTKTFDDTISGAIDGNAATATALATARTIGGTSFDGTGNIAVAAATNLTASTSTAVGLGTIELGHATDTTIARSAAGVVTIEGNKIETRKTLLHLQQTSFSRDIATTEFFIPLNTVAESTSITNVNIPMVMPVDGKLLKLHMRANQHHNTNSNTVTFKLYDIDDGENWSAGASNVLGTKVIDGTARENIMVADFQDLTTSGASGTNAFSAGDSIGVTLQNSQDLALTNYLFTFVFELDFNSY